MESTSLGKDLTKMTQVLFFPLKTIMILAFTWLVVPLNQMLNNTIQDQAPPMLLFWVFSTLLFSHEVMTTLGCFASGLFREKFLEAFTNTDNRFDVKKMISAWFTLMCIRIFCFGKLNEEYFPGHGFDDKTYFYCVMIIFAVVGGPVLEKTAPLFIQKIFKEK